MSGQRPIFDLYVGSLTDEYLQPEPKVQATWQRLQPSNLHHLTSCTSLAFEHLDEIDQTAYQGILSEYRQGHISPLASSFLAYVGEDAAGACLVSMRGYYSPHRSYPYIDLVAINPAFQNQRLGGALLRQSLKALTLAGFGHLVHAHVRRGNTASERLFLSHGFLLWRPDD